MLVCRQPGSDRRASHRGYTISLANWHTTADTPVSRRELLGWAFYDFANSGYSTVVLTTVYSAYFVAVVAGQDATLAPGTATFLWTLTTAAANLIVLITAPALGAIADLRAGKKRFLLVSTLCCVAGTAGLAFAGPGEYLLGMGFLLLATIAFATGENLIAAFLPELSSPETMGRISGYGWSFGYFGGLLTLGACLAYINSAQGVGGDATEYVPATLIFTAIIFGLASIPTFVWLRERAEPSDGPLVVRRAFEEVWNTLRHAARHQDLFRFLGCLVLLQSGVATVITLAAIYAQEVMGFDSQQLIILVMLVNLTAAVGAFGFGFLQDRLGSVPSLAGAVIVWLAAIGSAWVASDDWQVWVAGNLIGLAMGSTQAGGRAVIGRFSPVARSGEFFGLWGLAARTANILGPLSYGVISWITAGDHRTALLSTLFFFVTGLLVLFTVNEQRGMQAVHVK